METAASQRGFGPQGAVLVPRIASERQRQCAAAWRREAAQALAQAEDLLFLVEPQAGQYGKHWEKAQQEHGRRMELLAQVRRELEHEADRIERSETHDV